MTNRQVKSKVKGFRTKDGAGVSLVRVLSNQTVGEFDPILMLDSFDSTNPDDYTAGFPLHPHRGIETISYLSRGKMVHKDTLGNEDSITDGEVQWMNAGSGILHEEKVPAAERLLGVQLWLNLPKRDKFSKPYYHAIRANDIEEIEIDSGKIRLLAGEFEGHKGFRGEHLPLDYYDIHLEKDGEISLETEEDDSLMVFTLLGNITIEDELIEEKTAAKLTNGDRVTIKNAGDFAQVLFIRTRALNEPVAWAGPIVMNSEEELEEAFKDLREGRFIRDDLEFDN
ncbi:pirin family protein [Anaerococcus sp.]|uniref:pirin family protein n=1 Tax=Anaerococcus sp. TaxID=1872515 RepID=UPI002A74AB71|nr:pirin family protein [Anaerococcus sp.]MDY2928046.1 pirin family protein [Anaerococcus sp.]